MTYSNGTILFSLCSSQVCNLCYDIIFLIYQVITWSNAISPNGCMPFNLSHQIWFAYLFFFFFFFVFDIIILKNGNTKSLFKNETENSYHKVITMCDKSLLQSVAEVCYKVRHILQSATEGGYKVCQVLKSASGITKCDRRLLQNASSNTKCDRLYYKVRLVLQSATVITKWDVTTIAKYVGHLIRRNYCRIYIPCLQSYVIVVNFVLWIGKFAMGQRKVLSKTRNKNKIIIPIFLL